MIDVLQASIKKLAELDANLSRSRSVKTTCTADQVGDNVDEINGRGADLFGSFAEATCASLVLSAASDLHIDFCALMYPIFSRFEPNRYYQGLFYMMRRLCMALFPVNS